MLQGERGLPLSAPPPGYPVDFPTHGILVDDEGHTLDTCARVGEVFRVIFGPEAGARREEAAELLDPRGRDLRGWLARGFWDGHIKQYSRSRRRAPIYWQLSVPSARYSIWLYYHRFTPDTLHTAAELAKQKLQHENGRLTQLRQDSPNPTRSQAREVEELERFVDELRALHVELERVKHLWKPDLNDGVIINFALLWRLVPQHPQWQRECRDCWEKLIAGEYDWSHLAMHLWPERVVPKCAADRSLAIAHGLEEVFWVEGEDGKWKARKTPQRPVAELVAERTSPAVKAALAELLAAPEPAGRSRGRKRQKVEP